MLPTHTHTHTHTHSYYLQEGECSSLRDVHDDVTQLKFHLSWLPDLQFTQKSLWVLWQHRTALLHRSLLRRGSDTQPVNNYLIVTFQIEKAYCWYVVTIRPVTTITWLPGQDYLSWPRSFSTIVNVMTMPCFLHIFHRLRFGWCSFNHVTSLRPLLFLSAGLRPINCLFEHKVPMSEKNMKKKAWQSRPYCYWAGSLVSAHMRPYFLLSEARWWQRGANNRSGFIAGSLPSMCSSVFDSSGECSAGDHSQKVLCYWMSVCLNQFRIVVQRNPTKQMICL